MNARMDGEFRAVHSEINRVEGKLSTEITGVEETLGTKIDELDKRMDVAQRLVKVEEQLKELQSRPWQNTTTMTQQMALRCCF